MTLNELPLFKNSPPFVIVTTYRWNELEYFGHHLARFLADSRIPTLFVERSPQRWPRNPIRDVRQWITGRAVEGVPRNAVPDGLTIMKPRWLPPSRHVRALNGALVSRDVHRIRAQGGAWATPPVMLVLPPTYNSLALIHYWRPRAVAYLNNFNYEEDEIMPDVLVSEREVVERADVLFAHTPYCVERVRKMVPKRRVRLCPPGVHFQRFSAAFRGDEAVRPRRVCYFGGIGPHLDIEAYNSYVAAGLEVTMIGVADPRILGLLDPRIVVVRPVRNVDLPRLLAAADVLVLAYRNTPYMKGVFPAKFFECLATRKPLIVAGLPELEPYRHIAYVVERATAREVLPILANTSRTETASVVDERARVAAGADWSVSLQRFLVDFDSEIATRNAE